MRYTIEVFMTPHEHDSPKDSYFWCIKIHRNRECFNGGHGWAVSPEEAWRKARSFYAKTYSEE